MENFINDIKNSLKAIDNGTIKSTKQWTVAVKKALIDVADKHGLLVNCINIGGQYKKNHIHYEWLYDIIMYTEKEDDILDEVHLVCECEWQNNRGELENDFSKLLLARSKLRLMIYQVQNEKSHVEFINRFRKIIEESKSCFEGDVYLFAIYFHPDKEFRFEKYIKK